MSISFKSFFTRLAVGVITVVVALVPSASLFALDLETIKIFATNNILYYDPTNNCTDIVSSKPSGTQITWIGDSYTIAAQGIITQQLPGVDIHTENSQTFADGIAALQGMSNLRDFVVFALGTDDFDTIGAGAADLEAVVGTNRTIILVTPQTYGQSYPGVISEIKAASQTYSNIIVADWATASSSKLDEYFDTSSSPASLNDNGAQAWFNTIYSALPGGVTMLAGSTNEERIWNYFASANIAGVSDNAAVIAGIMGNLQQESSFNPFAHSAGSSYYGVYQTDNAELLAAMSTAGLDQYWGSSTAPQDAQNQALTIQLDFLTQQNPRFSSRPSSFVKNLNTVSVQSPEAYAELFLVSVEGAYAAANGRQVTENDRMLDQGVLDYSDQYWASVPMNHYYQNAKNRRNYARTIYDKYVDFSATSNSTSSGTGTGAEWTNEGWLVAGSIPGAVIEDANNYSLGETPATTFITSNGKPNKILLHSTEGQQNGMNAYPANNRFPAHFTIDVKNKTVSQHFPLWKPSAALKAVDAYGAIQIEIVGFSTADRASSPYYLPNFTSEEWDYLAVLLAAISSATGIPLTTSVDWANPSRISEQAFLNYSGVLGHMHAPKNDHVDPGNIWQYVSEAVSRNPDAAKFSTGSNATSCSSPGGLISGGMTLQQAQELMAEYYELAVEYSGTRRLSGKEMSHTFNDGTVARIYHSSCAESDLTNCSSFSQYFINRFTTADVTAWNGGIFVQELLKLNVGFVDGGTTPKAYAIFSTSSGSTMCGSSLCGHTGVVLGIDEAAGKIIIGEAGCSGGLSFIGAKEKDLSKFTDGSYTYAYTDNILKGGI